MYEFKYHRPATVRQAANLLIKNEDAKVIAGGHTLLPVMKKRPPTPASWVAPPPVGGPPPNNDPASDYPAAGLALGATIVTNKRRLKPEEFFQGLFTTALESDEIITKVMFPLPKKAAYMKFRHQASRYALGGVFVAKRPSDVRVAVTGAGSEGVFRVTAFEEALKKRFSPNALDGLTVPADELDSDP